MDRIFVRNLCDFLMFGFKLYNRGVCDKPIKGKYKLSEEFCYLVGNIAQEEYAYCKHLISDCNCLK